MWKFLSTLFLFFIAVKLASSLCGVSSTTFCSVSVLTEPGRRWYSLVFSFLVVVKGCLMIFGFHSGLSSWSVCVWLFLHTVFALLSEWSVLLTFFCVLITCTRGTRSSLQSYPTSKWCYTQIFVFFLNLFQTSVTDWSQLSSVSFFAFFTFQTLSAAFSLWSHPLVVLLPLRHPPWPPSVPAVLTLFQWERVRQFFH